jgi:type II secretory pathway pseudopilin PulG
MTRTIFKRGFSIVELIAVIIVMIIIASIVLPMLFGGKTPANNTRCRDEAAALNAAETSLVSYINTTAVSLGTVGTYTNLSVTPALRIQSLNSWGFLTSQINPNDVTLDTTKNPPLWSPVLQ